MDKKIRIGVIGCGITGKWHMQAAQQAEHALLSAVCDSNAAAAIASAETYGAHAVYTNPLELIENDDVDAIVLALPTNIRLAFALKALSAGKHLLLEKPAALHENELQQIQLAQGDRTVAFCSSRFRFLEHALAVREWIREGHLGEIRLVRCRVNQPSRGRPEGFPPTWRTKRALNGGGIVANWGTYDLDYLMGLLDWRLKPVRVTANLWGLSPGIEDYFPDGADAETYGAAYIQCENNSVITYERGEYMSSSSEEAWQIIGSKGSVNMNMTWPSTKIITCTVLDPELGSQSFPLWDGTENSERINDGPFLDFVEAIRMGRPPCTGIEEALITQRMLDAIYASQDQQKTIHIPVWKGEDA